jgi:hypothetical protein
MRVKHCKSVFELLKQDKEEVLLEEMELREDGRKEPLLEWSVNNLTH